MARLSNPNMLPSRQLQRFLLVGITAFAFEYSVFFMLFNPFKLPLLAAHSLSFGCGLVTSFLLNRQWTFRQGQFRQRRAYQFGLYMALALFNLLVTNTLLHSLEYLGLHPYIGKVLVMLLVAGWNFALYRTVIFRSLAHKQPV